MKKILLPVLSVLMSVGAFSQRQGEIIDEIQLRKMMMTYYSINQLYVDDIDPKRLIEDGINGMLKELDPHSIYTPAKEVQALNEPLDGGFDGIGVQYNMSEDTLVVIQPVSGGPSDKVGIICGDKIVAVNDTAIAGVKMSREEIMKRLRGPKGTKVKLGVIRRGIKDQLVFNVTRDKIPLYTIDAYYMIDSTTGYVRISSFGQTTHDEFVKICTRLRAKGMKDIVIDLQGNGGGYLQAAVMMADEFLSNNEMIVYTEGRSQGRRNFRASSGKMDIGKVVVLVDGYTASASEILSGALQDNDRGVIVGRRTFAKGLVQRPINLPDGSLIRLTVAHYYSPVGRCFQKPYVKGDRKSYDNDMLDRLNSGELTNPDSIHFPDSLKFKTVGGRTVYGGGGIMPDVYVPLDTTRYTRFHRELTAKGCVVQATLKFLDSHRKKFEKEYRIDEYRKAKKRENKGKEVEYDMTHFDRFKDSYEIPQELIDIVLEKAKEAKVVYNDSVLAASLPTIKLQLKALLARDLWDMSEYFQIINPLNEIYLKGLEAIKDEKYNSILSSSNN
ncbi:MAG: S41 family peptidase [Bacteroidaceae bacterium]|nr:S41 family peptidase [Bacteroidaceae bacterium]